MTPELRVVQSEPVEGDLALVIHHAAVLNDLTIRSVKFTTMTQVRQLDEAISAAALATAFIDIAAVCAELAASTRPAAAQEIKRQLQVLIGSFPNSSKQDLSIFGVALLEDVVADKPAIMVLTNACRKLRRTNNFVPTISEVLSALTAENIRHQSLLSDVQGFAASIEGAKVAAAAARERVGHDLERMIRFCISQIQCGKSADFFDPEVAAEARRRIGPDLDEAMRAANKKRLEPLLKLQPVPKKDSGWNP